MQKVFTVRLNGTKVNPFHQIPLITAPYPTRMLLPHEERLHSLGRDPIPLSMAEVFIRRRLESFSSEFIDLCVRKYTPGKMTLFSVVWEESDA